MESVIFLASLVILGRLCFGSRYSEDVCWSIRNVKSINESFYNMRCFVMFSLRQFRYVSLCCTAARLQNTRPTFWNS